MIATLFLPEAVIATRPSSASGEWRRGDDRSLLDDCWMLSTDDPGKKKDDVVFLASFDSVVAYGGSRLSDAGRLHDASTKRAVLARALSSGVRQRSMGAQGASRLARYMDWLFRWRLSIGLESTRELEERHFRDFLSVIAGGDVLDLVPIVERLDRFVEEVVDGAFVFPVVASARSGLSLAPDWAALGERLGVPSLAIARSPVFRSELVDRLPVLDPANASALAAHVAASQLASVSDGGRSARAVESFLEPWLCLSRMASMRLLPHDPIGFDPFAGRDVRSLSSSFGRVRARTGTILPPDLLRLMDAAARWVIDFGPHILRVWERLGGGDVDKLDREALADLRLSAPAGLPPIVTGRRSESGADAVGGLSAVDAVKLLMTACAILVGAFGARRIGEITSLQAGCLVEDASGVLELTIYVEKTLRDLDRIPVPAMMRNVVRTLEALTASTRALTGEPWLFEVSRSLDVGDRGFLKFSLGALLGPFAEVNGLEPPEGWDRWSLKAHQLRRGFAVAYYHGFQAASLDALSRFLRHLDPEMTRIYVNEVVAGSMGRLREEISARTKAASQAASEADRRWMAGAKALLSDLADRGAAFDAVRCEDLVHRMMATWDGFELPVGAGAARLYGDLDGMVAEAAAKVRIGSRSNDPDALRLPLADILRGYAATHRLEPVPGGVAHCACRPDDAADLSAAECLKVRASRPPALDRGPPLGPDFAFSGSYVCLTCVHCVAFADDQANLAGVRAKLALSVERPATPAAALSAAGRLAAFKDALAVAKAKVPQRLP